jgi:hypothetical protein
VNGPVILFLVGLALIAVHLAGRRRRRPLTCDERRAGYQLLRDLITGSATLSVFTGYMFAPRHILPGQRIPRPKARRMVQAMDPDAARKMIR